MSVKNLLVDGITIELSLGFKFLQPTTEYLVEPCADSLVSAVARRSILLGAAGQWRRQEFVMEGVLEKFGK